MHMHMLLAHDMHMHRVEVGSPWGRALGGTTRHFQTHEPSGDAVPSVSLGSPPSTADETKEAYGAASSPPARRLLLVGQWVARKSIWEGIGWAHSPVPAFGAHGRRGGLESCIVALRRPTRREASFRHCDLAIGPPAAPPRSAASRLGSVFLRHMSLSRPPKPRHRLAAHRAREL